MSHYRPVPGNSLPRSGYVVTGMKRTYNGRANAHYSAVETPNQAVKYSYGWIPPGTKRMAPPDMGNQGPHKVMRTENMRSFSTSSASSSSSPSSSSSSALHKHSSSHRVVIKGVRAASTSALETKSSTGKQDKEVLVVQVKTDNASESKVSSKESRLESKESAPVSCSPDDRTAKKKKTMSNSDGKESVKETVSSSTKKETEVGPSTSSRKPSIIDHHSDQMSRQIWGHYVSNRQSKEEEHAKEQMRIGLQACIRQIFPYSLLILGGSSLNGFGSRGCDADLCLYLSDAQLSERESRQVLVDLRTHLKLRCGFITNMKVIFAKVSILKFSHKHRDIECDLNINHHTGVRNTALLQVYSKLDWRVAPLVMLIKQWAKNHGVSDASQGTLSSYSYVLLVLNYLQVGCKPPVVMSVQEQDWGRSLFNPERSIHCCWNQLYDPSLPRNSNQSKNTQDLYSLLKGFFAYYANFKWETTVISVRLGSCFPTHLLPPYHHGWRQKFIFIEEPFDRINTARSVFDWSRYRLILDALEDTHLSLCKDKDFSLDSFLLKTR